MSNGYDVNNDKYGKEDVALSPTKTCPVQVVFVGYDVPCFKVSAEVLPSCTSLT